VHEHVFIVLVNKKDEKTFVFSVLFEQDTTTAYALDKFITEYRNQPTYSPGDSIIAYTWAPPPIITSSEENSMTISGGGHSPLYRGFDTQDLLKSPIPL